MALLFCAFATAAAEVQLLNGITNQDSKDLSVTENAAISFVRNRFGRSTEYLGPLLQTLAEAYEKYEDQDPKKKSKVFSSFIRSRSSYR